MNNSLIKSKTDISLTVIFSGLTVSFILLMALNNEFFNWAFGRHQNLLSWYIRPLFIIPFCIGAFKRKGWIIALTVFSIATSMFWFPVPEVVSPTVQEFLAMEKDFLMNNWSIGKILVTMIIPVSLGLLAAAFWKRNLKLGLIIIALIAVAKSLWSIIEGGESGLAVLLPAAVGLVLCVGFFYFWNRKKIRKS